MAQFSVFQFLEKWNSKISPPPPPTHTHKHKKHVKSAVE